MNKNLERTFREEKQEIDKDVREKLMETLSKITRVVFDNETLDKVEGAMDSFEFEEGEDTVIEDYKSLRNEKVKNIDNYSKMFKIEIEINIDKRLQSFSKEFRENTIGYKENKENYLSKIKELNETMTMLENYANNVIEDAIAILDGATRAAIMKIQIVE